MGVSCFRGSVKINTFLAIILVALAGLFFSDHSEAKKEENLKKTNLSNGEGSYEKIDPLHRIGKGTIKKDEALNNICLMGKGEKKREKKESNFKISEYKKLVAGYPIETMLPEIAKKDKLVAVFILSIAKKESNWGKRSPQKDGQNCFNYWGYRGSYNQTDSGYSCFDNPGQAVAVIGERIEKLIKQGLSTPEKMVIWKCGSSCSGHDPQDVKKWISDVKLYCDKLDS